MAPVASVPDSKLIVTVNFCIHLDSPDFPVAVCPVTPIFQWIQVIGFHFVQHFPSLRIGVPASKLFICQS